MMNRMHIVVLLVVVLGLFSPCHGRRFTEQRQQRSRLGSGNRALGPIRDAFLDTLDELTKPDDTVEENEVDSTTTGTPTSAPTVLTIPTTVPILELVLSPSSAPSSVSSSVPSDVSSSDAFSNAPSSIESNVPSTITSNVPSTILSTVPSTAPSDAPSITPSTSPSSTPVILPSDVPSLVPTTIPSVQATSVPSDLPSIMPTSGPSDVPSIAPSDIPSAQPSNSLPSTAPSSSPSDAPSMLPSNAPSNVPSTVPSSIPSMLPSDAPSTVPSTVPSSIPGNILSYVPSGSPTLSNIVTVTTAFSEDDIAVFESTCTQFLYDYLPLVQPNTYSNLDCKVVTQTAVATRRLRRQLQDDAAVIPFRVKDVELLVEVTGDAPGESNFSDVVSQTFETFGTELKDSLTQTSDAFSDSEGEGNVVTPEGPTEETTDVTRPSTNGPTFDWAILGSAIAGGVCLALIVSLFLVKNRSRRHASTTEPTTETKIDLAKSKSFSVSSVRDVSSFREYSLIKLVSIEASRSLAKNEGEDDGDLLPPTPLGVDTVPVTLQNSPEEIKSELSPSSFFGDLVCCNNNIDRMDTDVGNIEGGPIDTQNTDINFDRNSTYMTGLSSAANETATKMDDFMSSQSDSSDLEGLHLALSNTNTFSNQETKGETEQRVEAFKAQTVPKRRTFSFRPHFLKPRPSVVNSNHQVVNDSTEVEEDCCATDNWTVKTNSVLTPKKANTTASGSVKGQSGSFE